MANENADCYTIRGLEAQYFSGPIASTKNGWRTVPNLLRTVADWMDANNVQDPEVDGLALKTVFIEDGDDEFYETITLYHLEPSKVLNALLEKG